MGTDVEKNRFSFIFRFKKSKKIGCGAFRFRIRQSDKTVINQLALERSARKCSEETCLSAIISTTLVKMAGP
jgi:hypothetical protein